MMYLLDTHAFLWHAVGDSRLPSELENVINDPANDVSVSIASLWEIAIKASIGKLTLPTNVLGLKSLAGTQSIDIIPITVEAIHLTSTMDWFNKDPFDRMIAATSLSRGDILVTIEAPFERWGVQRIWDVTTEAN